VRSFLMQQRDIALPCNYTDCTLEDLLFGENEKSDVTVNWATPALRNARFDFSASLRAEKMDACAFPHYRDRELYTNCTIISANEYQKGFEYGWIVKSKDGRHVAILEEDKFTEIGTDQKVGEIRKKLAAAVEELHNAVYRRYGDKVRKIQDSLGWPVENIVLIFRTNRHRLNYTKVLEGNIILMCRESLEKYLGPTVWSLLCISENLANVKLKAASI